MKMKLLLALSLVLIIPSAAEAQGLPDLKIWKSLISYMPAEATQRAVIGRGSQWCVHRIEDAYGRLSLDYYPVTISRLPTVDGKRLSHEQLLEHLRKNLDGFVDHQFARFAPFAEPDKKQWASSNPKGAVLLIDIKVNRVVTDLACVVTAEAGPREWRFSTIRAGEAMKAVNDRTNAGAHPVSGNRAFGFTPRSDGSAVFYTIGADRATRASDEFWGIPGMRDIGYDMADKLWRSWQQKLVKFVNANGGVATVGKSRAHRLEWDTVRDSKYFDASARRWVKVP